MLIELGTLGVYASITGISLSTLKDKVSSYLKTLKEKNNEELAVNRSILYRRAVQDRKHIEVLSILYPHQELKSAELCGASIIVGDTVVPIAFVGKKEWLDLPENINLRDNHIYSFLDEVASPQPLSVDTITMSHAEIELFKLIVVDMNIYRLNAVNITGSHMNVTFSLDSFVNYRYGLGSLWGELLQGLVDTENDTQALVNRKNELLPRRMELLRNASQVANYSERLCVGGIHATVAMFRKEYNDFVIPVQTRSGRVEGGQYMLGVLPQGYHQPLAFPHEEMSFAQTFYREFFEELLGGKEASRKSRHLRHDWYTRSSEVMEWFSKPQSKYTLWITGFGLNLVSGNYEVSLLCIIEDPNFWSQHSHKLITSWEHSDDVLPLLSTRDSESISKTILQANWIGEGLYSLVRGLIYLSKTRPSNVALPPLSIVFE